ncbi:MAG: MaoC family dehydratase [Actinomycetota bacterium]
MRTFDDLNQLDDFVGTHLGFSDWIEITQRRINLFAEATDDHQWIHVDPERAVQGPFTTTISHGYLTLSLAVPLVAQIYRVAGVRMGINYGSNKVRFVSPVPVGSRIRAGATLNSVEDVPGGRQVVLDVTFEIEGSDKPACVAQVVSRLYV